MTLWSAPQAEAWMREHPGRWLEDNQGDMWQWCVDHHRVSRWLCATFSSVEEVDSPTKYAAFGEANCPEEPVYWHPPREHWAAEHEALRETVERIAGFLARWATPIPGDDEIAGPAKRAMELAASQLRALFRAAPEGS